MSLDYNNHHRLFVQWIKKIEIKIHSAEAEPQFPGLGVLLRKENGEKLTLLKVFAYFCFQYLQFQAYCLWHYLCFCCSGEGGK